MNIQDLEFPEGYQVDIFVKGIDAAIDDYESMVSPFFDGYKPEFVDGYKYGQSLIRRVNSMVTD